MKTLGILTCLSVLYLDLSQGLHLKATDYQEEGSTENAEPEDIITPDEVEEDIEE